MKTLSQLKEVGTLMSMSKQVKDLKSQRKLAQAETIWEDKRERVRLKSKKRQ